MELKNVRKIAKSFGKYDLHFLKQVLDLKQKKFCPNFTARKNIKFLELSIEEMLVTILLVQGVTEKEVIEMTHPERYTYLYLFGEPDD